MNKHFQIFSYIAASRIIVSILQASFYIVFAALLEPHSYGEMSYIIAIAGTASIISRLGFPSSVVVFQSKGNVLVSNQINLVVLITTFVAAVILIPINLYSSLLCVGLTLFLMNQQNLVGLKKYKQFLLVSILRSSLIIILPLVFFFIFEINGIIFGMFLANILAGLNFLTKIKPKLNLTSLKENYHTLLHNFGVESSMSLVRWIDKIIIVPILGFQIAGLYQFNLQILLFLSILPASLYLFFLSETSNLGSSKRIIYVATAFSVVIVLFSIFLTPILVPEIFPKYVTGIPALQVMLFSLVPLTLSSILTGKLQNIESRKVGFPAVIKIISMIFLVFLLGKQWDLIGLSFAVLFSSVIETSLLYVVYKRH